MKGSPLSKEDALVYGGPLGIAAPWKVTGTKQSTAKRTVEFGLGIEPSAETECPRCGLRRPRRGMRRRRWRDLELGGHKTMLAADVPLGDCPEHGTVAAAVPWAEPGSPHTTRFEESVADWLKERVDRDDLARTMGLSRSAVDGIAERAAKREDSGARKER